MREITIYTDGACRGNPGPGGYGVILEYVDTTGKAFRKELSQGYRLTTNNRMEVLAAITGLSALKEACKVVLYSDSKYLVDAIEKGWLRKWQSNDWFRDAKRKEKAKNVDLWMQLSQQLKRHQVEFRWVKGHADNPYNNRCDELAVEAALNKEKLLEDTL